MKAIKFWNEFKIYYPMILMAVLLSFVGAVFNESQQLLHIKFPEIFEISKSFLQGWQFYIIVITFVLGYINLSLKLKKDQLFYFTIILFFSFTLSFLLFSLYFLMIGATAFLEIIENGTLKWGIISFTVMSKLWTIFVFPVLFWGFANDIFNNGMAKKFYSVFIIAAVVGSSVVLPFQFFRLTSKEDFNPFLIISVLLLLAAASKFMIMKCYNILFHYFSQDSSFKINKHVTGYSLMQHLKIIISSKPLFYIFILFLCWGISIIGVELTWKRYLIKAFSNNESNNIFMAYFSMGTGFASILMIFVSWYILNRFNWKQSAMITPILLCTLSILLFIFAVFPKLSESFGVSSLVIITIIGTFHNIFAKGLYFSLFNPTKEMIYIPLNHIEKYQGKAIIDTIAPMLGLLMGTLILNACLSFASIENGLITLFLIVSLVYFIWIFSVNNLTKWVSSLHSS